MTLEHASKYRCQHGIMENILVLVATEPRTKTHVMYGALLSYKQLLAYGERLEKNGLIKINGEGKWQITEKGKNFLANYQEFKEACA